MNAYQMRWRVSCTICGWYYRVVDYQTAVGAANYHTNMHEHETVIRKNA